MRWRNLFIPFLVAILLFIVDQAVKERAIEQGLTIANTGIAFGLFSDLDSLWSFVSLFLLALLVVYGIFSIKKEELLELIVLALLVGGGLSNSFDRFRRGSVVDYLSLGIGPTFNLADLAIFIGLVIVFSNWLWMVFKKLLLVKHE